MGYVLKMRFFKITQKWLHQLDITKFADKLTGKLDKVHFRQK